jgi:hypothetical protein
MTVGIRVLAQQATVAADLCPPDGLSAVDASIFWPVRKHNVLYNRICVKHLVVPRRTSG